MSGGARCDCRHPAEIPPQEFPDRSRTIQYGRAFRREARVARYCDQRRAGDHILRLRCPHGEDERSVVYQGPLLVRDIDLVLKELEPWLNQILATWRFTK